jgi:glycerol-3-phosphate acyltransferase
MVTMPASSSSPRARRSVVAELEGGLLRCADTFPYFMLVAFEASGLPRFAALLALWPLLRLLELAGRGGLALRAAALVATAGVPRAEVEAVSRAVLPKFMADDVDPDAWAAFGSCEGRRVVVATRLPRVMVERFAKEHLGAHEVVGCDLEYSRLRRCTGLLRGCGGEEAVASRVSAMFAGGDQPDLGIGRSEMARSFLPFCKVRNRSLSKFCFSQRVLAFFVIFGRRLTIVHSTYSVHHRNSNEVLCVAQHISHHTHASIVGLLGHG